MLRGEQGSGRMQQRKDEILAKKNRLAELKRQREQRQKDFSTTRQSIGSAREVIHIYSIFYKTPLLT